MAKKRVKRAARRQAGEFGVRFEGLERDRVYTREDLCRHFGYDADAVAPDDRTAAVRNLDRYFRRQFLERGLPVMPVGKTYLVSGESLWLWVTANSMPSQSSQPANRSDPQEG